MLKATLDVKGIDEEKLIKILDKFGKQRVEPIMVFKYSVLKATGETARGALQLEVTIHDRLALSELCRRLRIARGCEAKIEKVNTND
jgi:hypothetical protein